MFFRKKEPRGPSMCSVLAVGVLATVGAVTIVMRGKEIFECMTEKAKSLLSMGSCSCDSTGENNSNQ